MAIKLAHDVSHVQYQLTADHPYYLTHPTMEVIGGSTMTFQLAGWSTEQPNWRPQEIDCSFSHFTESLEYPT